MDGKVRDCICDYAWKRNDVMVRTCWVNDNCSFLRRLCIDERDCLANEVCVSHCCNLGHRTCTRVCPEVDPWNNLRLEPLDIPCVETALHDCL